VKGEGIEEKGDNVREEAAASALGREDLN